MNPVDLMIPWLLFYRHHEVEILVLIEISLQLLDVLPWNMVEAFKCYDEL